MTDTRLASRGNVRFKWHAPGAFANPHWPTVTELNAGQGLEALTLWENFEIGAQASETSEIAPIKAKSAVAKRAAANFGGSASFWYPGDHTDMTNLASLVYDIFKEVNVPGYISMSIDGEIGEAGQPAGDYTYANGDFVSIFGVITDEWDDMITGEEAFYYTRNFIKNGMLAVYTVASTTVPVLAVTGTQPAATPGALGTVSVTVNGRDFTRGMRYRSDDPTKVVASPSGILTRVAVGAADIEISLPNSTVTGTYAITA